ncbi:ATP-dependent Clp protease ATP-binding subunit ClpX, partial [Enterococcus faecalis]
EPEALKAIAAKAIERNTGAQGLRSIIEEIMMNVMFDVPSDESIEKVIITKMAAEGNDKPTIIYNKKDKKDV